MPYLDIADADNFLHLLQLFFAAHPGHRAGNEAMRTRTGMPGDYFLSMRSAQALAKWARKKHLITRASAEHLISLADANENVHHICEECGGIKEPSCSCCGGTEDVYLCRCACGTEQYVCAGCLTSGRSTSCGLCDARGEN
jgi:hypothetical protein